MPFAFGPISRAIRWEVQREAWGYVDIYVDDILDASPASNKVQEDLRGTPHLVTGLFGARGISEQKTRAGRVGDTIGYTLDLKRRMVTVARKNVESTLWLYAGETGPKHTLPQDGAARFVGLEVLAHLSILEALHPFLVPSPPERTGSCECVHTDCAAAQGMEGDFVVSSLAGPHSAPVAHLRKSVQLIRVAFRATRRLHADGV